MNGCDKRLGERPCVRFGETLGEGLSERLLQRLGKSILPASFKYDSRELEFVAASES